MSIAPAVRFDAAQATAIIALADLDNTTFAVKCKTA